MDPIIKLSIFHKNYIQLYKKTVKPHSAFAIFCLDPMDKLLVYQFIDPCIIILSIKMAQIVFSSVQDIPSLKFADRSQTELDESHKPSNNDDNKKESLREIVRKYRIQHYVNTFRQKIKRNNICQTPAIFELKVNDEQDNSFLHIEGIQIKNKKMESFIFAGDILFTLIVFYISVFQAFLQTFRTSKSSSFLIILLKLIAIIFQFSKVFIKSIKKDIINGKLLTHVDNIIWESVGMFELTLYSSAICMILLTIIDPTNYSINVVAFFVATIKLFKIPINLKVLDLHYIDSHRKQCYWNLIKIIIFQLIFMHFVAAVLLAMSSLHQHNWLVKQGLDTQNWDVQYYWAMYWSATLITTTGFGDFVATNEKEALLVAFLQLFSSVVLAYNLNLIGIIVMNLRDSDQSLQKKTAIFRRMNDQSPVTSHLRQKIQGFIQNQRQINETFQYKQRSDFLNELPEQLKTEYYNDVNQTIFHQLPFFRNLRLQTLNNLALQFSCNVRYPGESIIGCRQQSKDVYILKRGQVCFQYNRFGATFMNHVIIQTFIVGPDPYTKPRLLNNTFLNRSRQINFDIKAHDYSLIMSLSQQRFLATIRKGQIEKEHFFTIYDKHQNNFIFQDLKCIYCTDQYHNKFQCPKLHFMPFKSRVVRKNLIQNDKKQHRIRLKQKLQTNWRKQHCYYLRKSYYKAYEGYKNIVAGKHVSHNMINRLIKMKTLAQQFENQDILQSFQHLFRKVMNEDKNDNNLHASIDVDVLHDYLAYFTESNPKELDMKYMEKKEAFKPTKLSHRLTMLSQSSKKHLYREMNMIISGQEINAFLGELILQYEQSAF